MRAVLDACVLFPPLMRALLLAAADRGHFAPVWSPRILEEWARAVERDGGTVRGEIALLRLIRPDASVDPAPIDAGLPDADDIHVLAACVAGNAGFLVTRNARDFPHRALARYGVMRTDPDTLLSAFAREDAAGVLAPLSAIPPADRRAALKRAGLPRVGKVLRDQV